MLSHHGFSNIHTYAVHPGEIPTDLWKGYGKIELLIHSLAEMVCRVNALLAKYPTNSGSVFGFLNNFLTCRPMLKLQMLSFILH